MPDDNDPDRFECILEPGDLWMVWDGARDEPALVNGQYAIGLSLAEANAILSALKRAHGKKPGPFGPPPDIAA